METLDTGALLQIAGNTQSELIMFFVILAVALVPFGVLLLKIATQKSGTERERVSQFIEREKRIIEVITANTEVQSGLKATLEMTSGMLCESMRRIHERIDEQTLTLNSMGAALGSGPAQRVIPSQMRQHSQNAILTGRIRPANFEQSKEAKP